jgi:hypothetical protein
MKVVNVANKISEFTTYFIEIVKLEGKMMYAV